MCDCNEIISRNYNFIYQKKKKLCNKKYIVNNDVEHLNEKLVYEKLHVIKSKIVSNGYCCCLKKNIIKSSKMMTVSKYMEQSMTCPVTNGTSNLDISESIILPFGQIGFS